MEFIVDNIVWFIIGGIVILMAIVGYIADATDFGRKSFEKKVKPEKEKKEKEPKEEKVVEPIITPETGINDIVTMPTEEYNVETQPAAEETQEGVDQSLFEPLPSVDEVFSGAENVETPVQEDVQPEETEATNSDDDIWKF